jgi:predicted nucleic acid-binding protein
VIYLDANVFVYAALNRKALGERSRSIIGEVQKEKIMAVTSALSFDELVWAVRKQRGESDGISAGEIFLNMPRLEIMDVRLDLLSSALNLLKKYHLNPRDAIHAASALNANVEYIVSEDPDFDSLSSIIKRKPILQTLR